MKQLFATLLFLGTLLPIARAQNTFGSELDGWCSDTSVYGCPTFKSFKVGPPSLCGNPLAPEWSRIGTPSQASSSSVYLCAKIQNGGSNDYDYTCEGLFTSFNFVPGISYTIHVGVVSNDNSKAQLKFYSTDNLRQFPFPDNCQDPYIENMVVGNNQVTQHWIDELGSLGYPAPQIIHIGDINLPYFNTPSAPSDYVLQYTPTSGGSQLAFHAAMSDPSDPAQVNVIIEYVKIEYSCDATFTYSSSTLTPNTVTFTPNSPNGSGYDWNFGDGNSVHAITSSPVQHTYGLGSYYTCMSTSFDRNNSCNYCAPICINKITDVLLPPPGSSCSSDFRYSIYSATPNIVNLTAINPGQGGVWDFGDGTFLYGYNPSPTHTYSSGGTYTICLISYDPKGGMCSQTCATICVGGPATNAGKSKKPSSLLGGSVKAELYPNPAQKETTLKLALPENTDIAITVFDATGKKVYEENKTGWASGAHETIINTADWAPGVYYVSIKTESENIVKMLSVVK